MAKQDSKRKPTLTPMDIHNQEFKVKMSGYDRYQVDSFLDQVVDAFGDALDQNVDLENEIVKLQKENKQLKDEITKYDDLKSSVNDSLIAAQKTAEDIRKKAEAEAANIINDANAKADHTTDDLKYQNTTLKNDYERLKAKVLDFREDTKKQLENQIKELDDSSWQYYLDKYYNTERIYPVDGEPIMPDNSAAETTETSTIDNQSQSSVDLPEGSESTTEEPLTGDSPTAESVKTENREIPKNQQGPTIIFPDDYKDHK